MREKKVLDSILGCEAEVVSFDLFDTVLYRNTKPESLRFYEVCRQTSLSKDASERLFLNRHFCHHLSYRISPSKTGKERDSSFSLISDLMLASLPECEIGNYRKILAQEVLYEKENLRLNRKLMHVLKTLKGAGIKIIVTSDMYLPKEALWELLDYFNCAYLFHEVYVSSEHCCSKAGGGLFDVVLSSESIAPNRLFHLGDNFHSDFYSPALKGINSFYYPRSLPFRGYRKLRRKLFHLCKKEFMHEW